MCGPTSDEHSRLVSEARRPRRGARDVRDRPHLPGLRAGLPRRADAWRAPRPAPRGALHHAARPVAPDRPEPEPPCRLMSASAAMMDVVATQTSKTLVGRDTELKDLESWLRDAADEGQPISGVL